MTNPTMKLVPAEPTEEMLREGHRKIDWCRDKQNTHENEHPSQTDWAGTSCKEDLQDAHAAMLAASPHAGQVSREQVEQLKAILKTVMVGRLADDVVHEFLHALGLQVEED